ncbi:MAG: M3 family oligoendopeptidase [Alphaproteobacteria bacterium]|nr:M3 family oligoendopeptidase [Alphaproteobacteria bacterium]
MKNKMPAWDLSDLYKGIDDPQITKDLETYRKDALKFARNYKGRLASLSADEFYQAIKDIENRSKLSGRLGGFAYLNMVTQMKNSAAITFYQSVEEKMTDYIKPIVFFTLEFNKLPQNKINDWLKDERIKKYKYWIKRLRKFKDYELTEPEEQILLEKSITSGEAWVRLYEETSSRLIYTVDGKKYNDAELSKLLLDKDEKLRRKAGKEMNRVLFENSHLFTFIYNMVMKDKAIEDDKRGFKSPISARNMSEDVSDKSVEVLTATVKKHYKDIAHRFYKLKAKWLGMKKINYWDRNAPLPFSADINYTWDEAVKIVLNAYKEFSPKLYNIAKDFFDNNWIDVPPRDGKRSGAFCSSPITTSHPYLMLNFAGKQNDVLTLAHELGHGCHHQLRVKNGELNEHTRMTSEEVASVFGEMIVFQSMLNNTKDDKAKLCLIASKVGDMINTSIRQIAFHCFETRAHAERKNGELTEERLSQIWVEEMRASLGNYVEIDEDSTHIWSMVGHFFFLPFYVYAYSYADCFVNSLYRVKESEKVENFADKYLDMLSKTALEDYDKILKPFGLNPNSTEFWEYGLELISSYIDLLEKLDKKIKLN